MSNDVVRYFHCRKCIEELPVGVMASDYQSIEAGIDTDGRLVIWCKRHEILIGRFEPKNKLVYQSERGENDRGNQGN